MTVFHNTPPGTPVYQLGVEGVGNYIIEAWGIIEPLDAAEVDDNVYVEDDAVHTRIEGHVDGDIDTFEVDGYIINASIPSSIQLTKDGYSVSLDAFPSNPPDDPGEGWIPDQPDAPSGDGTSVLPLLVLAGVILWKRG